MTSALHREPEERPAVAQEAIKVAPHAVSRDREGYLRVRYEELGVPFQTYEHWLASGASVKRNAALMM